MKQKHIFSCESK